MESIRSTAESVRETPINNETTNFIKVDRFLYGKKWKGRSDKGQDKEDGYIGGRIWGWTVETEHNMRGEMSKGFPVPLPPRSFCYHGFCSLGLFPVPVVTDFIDGWSR